MDIEIGCKFINPKVFRSTDSGYPVNSANRAWPDTDICHSGQAKSSAGISSFLARARVWEIPVFPCGETGMTVLVQACAVVRRSGYPVYSANRTWPGYLHLSFRPGEVLCRNLIFSGTCLSPRDSGLPLRGNRTDGADAGTCCAQTKWGAGNYSLLISGFKPGFIKRSCCVLLPAR